MLPDDWTLQVQFNAMRDAYRGTGGIARIQELLALFRRNHGPDEITLTHWVASREVLCFAWEDQIWFPSFQFDRQRLAPREDLASVYLELVPTFDPWDMACWFALPNPWTGDRSPVDSLSTNPPAVLDAARAEHFLLNG